MRKFLAGVALVAASIGTVAGTAHADSAGKWRRYASNAMPHITAIQDAMQSVQSGASAESVTAVEGACESLATAIDDGRDALVHSPSKRLNRLMREALTTFRVASIECVSGDYSSAGADIVRGVSPLEEATTLVHEKARTLN